MNIDILDKFSKAISHGERSEAIPWGVTPTLAISHGEQSEAIPLFVTPTLAISHGEQVDLLCAVNTLLVNKSTACPHHEIMQAYQKPHDCQAFGRECTPEDPLGALMGSSEGACAAYYL